MTKKIISIENLKKVILKLKDKRKKIVLCHGVFDLLHIGHIKHFKEAKNLGDVLVVTLTPDRFVNKGPSRPAFNERLRLEAVAALEVIDFVALNKSPTAVLPIEKLKPNIYCKGFDYKNIRNDISGQIKNEIKAVKKGLRILEIPVKYRERVGVSKITGTFSGTIKAGTKIIYTIFKYLLT